jgi:PKD repeat protein
MHSDRTNFMTCLRVTAILGAVSVLGGCSLESQSAPDLAGPSGFAISLSLTSSPQVLPRDGSSRATITLTARNEVSNTPVAGQRISLTTVPSTAVLSSNEVRTGADGRAQVTVTAPPADALTEDDITVVAAPIDGMADQVRPRSLSIALVFDETGKVDVAARFSVTPDQPKVGEQITFDASASKAPEGAVIKQYRWVFGDGTEKTTTTPTTNKKYDEARVYAVELTVVDDLDRRSKVAQNITVVP